MEKIKKKINFFFFWGFAEGGEAVGGLQWGEGKSENLFSGESFFLFASANLFLDFVRAQKGVWGMNAGGLNLIFW